MMIGTISIFLAEALILPTGFITAVFLARKLGPADYGLFALVSRLVIWTEWSSTAIFAHATIKFVGETENWKPVGRTVIRLHLLVGCGTGALVWLLSQPLSSIFNEPAMADYLKLFAIDIPIFSLASANVNLLVGMGHFKERSRISAGRLIARLVLIILFVEMGLSVRGAIMGCIGASVVELVISRVYIRPSLFSGPRISHTSVVGLCHAAFYVCNESANIQAGSVRSQSLGRKRGAGRLLWRGTEPFHPTFFNFGIPVTPFAFHFKRLVQQRR